MRLIIADLGHDLPAVPPLACGEQWVLVRLHGRPLGYVRPPAEGCPPAALDDLIRRALEWPLATQLLEDRLAPRPPRAPVARVTVAVCTRNRADLLGRCLDALVALDYPAHLMDLVVVDNAPSDHATQDLVHRYSRIRYLCEPRAGLDRARTLAARAALGDIVAFTDDDAIADRGWVRAIEAAFAEEPGAMCVTGLVAPDAIDTPAQRLFEEYGGFGRGFERVVYRVDEASGVRTARQYGGTGRFGTGANMAFRRTFFERHGYFDPALDVGTPTNGGGDLDMFFRVLKSGAALVYEPAALVRHRHRLEYADLRTQIRNNGIGFYAYLVRTAVAYPDERAAVVRLGAWWLWWWHARRLARWVAGRPSVPLDLIVAELLGSLVGLGRYQQSRRWLAREVA